MTPHPMSDVPVSSTTRVVHPLRFRRLVVDRIALLTPRMRRVVFVGDDLQGFTSLSFDDHVKLFFPTDDGQLPTPVVAGNGLAFPEGQPRPEGRDFTPRRWDATRHELSIDFGLHGRGPATRWAASAAPGATIGAGGPRASSVVSDTFAWNLLVGDETALPAIARRLEELPPAVQALAVIQIEDDQDRVPLDTAVSASVHWIRRRGDVPVDAFVAGLELPPGDGFAWVAGEGGMARRMRRHLIDDRRMNPASIKASAYWSAGVIGRHEVIAD
jgi:NADPH-dependent ferric siderophore reductase